jgi:SAM-dependent methyltransferase
MRRFIRRIRSVLQPPPSFPDELRYTLNEISELRQLVRLLLAESPAYRAYIGQTSRSFDLQWDKLPSGVQLLGHPDFDSESVSLVERYTGLSAAWFKGRTVLDAGCGNGRWSYTLAKLGARVTAIDQSLAGLEEVARVCAKFDGFATLRRDLLEPLELGAMFDVVWHFGVAHHTGDTRRALHHVCEAVRPGGILFTMIYGEPREGRPGEFAEINSYTELRRATAAMTFDERIAFLRARYPEHEINAYFDAVSPKINDLHRFDEVCGWLIEWGFTDVTRTFDNRNLFITARRAGSL